MQVHKIMNNFNLKDSEMKIRNLLRSSRLKLFKKWSNQYIPTQNPNIPTMTITQPWTDGS